MKSIKALSFVFAAFALVVLTACSSSKITEPSKTSELTVVPLATEKVEPAKKEKEVVIGFTLQNLNNPFFVAMSKGATAGAILHGSDVIIVSAEGDLAKQTAQIEDFIIKKVSVILLNAVDSKGIAGEYIVKRLNGKQNGYGNRETSISTMETNLQANGKGEIDVKYLSLV